MDASAYFILYHVLGLIIICYCPVLLPCYIFHEGIFRIFQSVEIAAFLYFFLSPNCKFLVLIGHSEA